MNLNDNEQMLVEAIKSLLDQKAHLGLSDENEKAEKAERGLEHLHNSIGEMFALKIADSTFFESLRSAFNKVHSYKYIDNPSFAVAMDSELRSQGIPAPERAKAKKFVEDIVKELTTESKAYAERDAGFNPDLDEIMDLNNDE